MLHFGHDALTIYIGPKFDMNWGDSFRLFHIYSKEREGKRKKTMKIRDEVQDYPNKPLKEAVMDKLKDEDEDEMIS